MHVYGASWQTPGCRLLCGSYKHDIGEHIKRHAEAAKVTGGYKPGLMVCLDSADQEFAAQEIPQGSGSQEAAQAVEAGATAPQSGRVAMLPENRS